MSFTPLVLPAVPLHERWFVPSHTGGDWSFYLSWLPLTLTAAMLAVTVAWRLVGRRTERPELGALSPLGRLVPWVPRLLGIHLGVTLLALGATGAFLTPAVELHGTVGTALLLLESGVGIWLVTGVALRPAAWLVLALGPVLAAATGPMALLECANLAAVAAFLVVLPPSAERHGAVEYDARRTRTALLVLRLGVGTALIALAFTEKFTNPVMAVHTLEEFPALDVFSLVGIHLSPETFVAVAGSVELLFGLLVISGALPQVAVLVAMVPFNATLLLFGQTELVGHLPVYGVFLALLAYGSHPRAFREVRYLPVPRLRGRRVAAITEAS
ncbi:hypothetical protein [Nocardioides iriomotensis]|uniref:DoxX family membrane protein n=1 Tax=Nocardioides iriomotensis TaxID=715784 RepID=A0A4Q5IW17_9ACTN|nr:hypothetical protein [Nocardioides iriomotensis]RYU10277.1 hypothetical protein ETU37_18000 [Nocardioides iriomotensis]